MVAKSDLTIVYHSALHSWGQLSAPPDQPLPTPDRTRPSSHGRPAAFTPTGPSVDVEAETARRETPTPVMNLPDCGGIGRENGRNRSVRDRRGAEFDPPNQRK